MTTISRIEIGIFVDITQGIDAEKNKIPEILVTPITKRVTKSESFTKMAGKNISAIPKAAALPTKIGFSKNSTVTG